MQTQGSLSGRAKGRSILHANATLWFYDAGTLGTSRPKGTMDPKYSDLAQHNNGLGLRLRLDNSPHNSPDKPETPRVG